MPACQAVPRPASHGRSPSESTPSCSTSLPYTCPSSPAAAQARSSSPASGGGTGLVAQVERRGGRRGQGEWAGGHRRGGAGPAELLAMCIHVDPLGAPISPTHAAPHQAPSHPPAAAQPRPSSRPARRRGQPRGGQRGGWRAVARSADDQGRREPAGRAGPGGLKGQGWGQDGVLRGGGAGGMAWRWSCGGGWAMGPGTGRGPTRMAMAMRAGPGRADGKRGSGPGLRPGRCD